jgi:NAD(P)H-quinone oxidoreductase subunit 5
MQTHRAGLAEHILFAILGGLTVFSGLLLLGQAFLAEAIYFPGITLDRLSAAIALLVAGVGTVAYRFSLRYLDGEPEQQRFLRWLFFTVLMAYLLMISTNLLLFFAAWLSTSLGLHQLLTFYRDRAEAQRPARKKFLISRLGDIALIAAIVTVWINWGTLDLITFLDRVDEPTAWSAAPTVAALLVVIAALTKSAQFPFHSWLPETMESPTPVSALMHAGIINAGGVLLLRFAPLLVEVPLALLNLAFVGALTAIIGMLAMWAQTNVKRTLAWSTVSQMGFMMIQLGLAVFPAAALHLVGHGFYKAWAFLRTGDVPSPAPAPTPAPPPRAFTYGLIGTAAAVPALALASAVTGFNPLHSPGELALSAVVALTIGQVWIAIFRAPATDDNTALSRNVTAVLLTLIVAVVAFLLYQGAAIFFEPVLGSVPVLTGRLAWIAAVLPVIAFVLLATVHALMPVLHQSKMGRAFYVHALHGFYLGALADRLVAAVWKKVDSEKKVKHA